MSAVVLASALLHAGWNATAHRIGDQVAGFALIGVGYTVCSVAVHAVYDGLLLQSYRSGDFAHVYPLARGTSPLVVALLSATVVGQRLGAVEVAGVAVLTAGLALLALAGGRLRKAALPATVAAVATGLSIAGYRTLDGVGVHFARSPLACVAWLFLLQGPVVPLAVLLYRPGRLARIPPAQVVAGLVRGAVSLVAYGLVLWAQAHGALARVAALRETSILYGAVTVAGVLLLTTS